MKTSLSKDYIKTIKKMQFHFALTFALVLIGLFIGSENNNNYTAAQTATTNTNVTRENTQQSPPQLDLILEEQGKITNQRVLEVHPHPKVEATFVANQTILGNISANVIGTYWANLYPDGTAYGEGHGITTTSDGEMMTWTAQGVGTISPNGDIRFEGSLFFKTLSDGSLAYLNNKVGVFIHEEDKEGNIYSTIWELK